MAASPDATLAPSEEQLLTALRVGVGHALSIDGDTVLASSVLVELGLDSITIMEAMISLEEVLGQDLPVEFLSNLEDIRTVQDVVDALLDAFIQAEAARASRISG